MRWHLAARFNASDGQGAARDGCSSRRASDDEKEQGTAAAARRAVGARKCLRCRSSRACSPAPLGGGGWWAISQVSA